MLKYLCNFSAVHRKRQRYLMRPHKSLRGLGGATKVQAEVNPRPAAAGPATRAGRPGDLLERLRGLQDHAAGLGFSESMGVTHGLTWSMAACRVSWLGQAVSTKVK